MRIYVAGKYGQSAGLSTEEKLANVNIAIEAGRQLILKGHNPYIPHLSHYIDLDWEESPDWERWMEIVTPWIGFCEAMLMLPNWTDSIGATREHRMAYDLRRIIYYRIEKVPDDKH